MSHLPASEALSRFTVLDLTRVRAGPTCVRQLADWGADVIKIEMPERGPDGHALGGPRARLRLPEPAPQQAQHDARTSRRRRGARSSCALVERADVVVENYRPDVKHRLRIAYDDLKAVNPRIVYASISGFGQDGPYSKRPGFDQIAQGMGGLMSITGLPGQGPVRVGIPIADLCAGLFAAQGILVALLERERSGEGQWIQTSLLQAQVFMLDFQAARWLVDQRGAQAGRQQPPDQHPDRRVPDRRRPHQHRGRRPDDLAALLRGDRQPELASDPAYATPAERSKNRDRLNAAIAEVTRRLPSAHWIDALNEAGVPCGPINTIDQVFADPQIRHLGMAQPVRSHERGDTELVGQPVIMSRTPVAHPHAAAYHGRAHRRDPEGSRL